MSLPKKLAVFLFLFAAMSGAIVATSGAQNRPPVEFKTTNDAVEHIPGIASVLQIQDVFRQIAETVMPAVVSINVESQVANASMPRGYNENDPFFQWFFGQQGGGNGNGATHREEAEGSGFIFTKDGYIFSNNHVVENATKITVVTCDNRQYEAEVVGTDPDTDIAILKIKGTGDFPYVAIGDSDQVRVGDWALAIGNPFGLAGSYTFGIVSAVGRPGMASFQSFIQTDVAVNPGNSGGPLVNIHGQVIGINAAIQSQTGGYMGISFAIPVNIAKSVAAQIIDHGYVQRGYLGIYPSDLDDETRQQLGLGHDEGVMISRVESGSPAEKAGIRQGDIITKLDGQPVNDPNAFRLKVGSLAPETSIKLEVLRDESRITLTAVLGQRTQAVSSRTRQRGGNDQDSPDVRDNTFDFLGATFANASGDILRANNASDGVTVVSMEGDSRLQGVIDRGDLIVSINRIPVHSIADLKKFAQTNRNVRNLSFKIINNGYMYIRSLQL